MTHDQQKFALYTQEQVNAIFKKAALAANAARIPLAKMAVSSIILSKTFDNGMICASEQSVIIEDIIYDEVKQEFIERGAYFLNLQERKRVAQMLLKDGHINPAIIGQSVTQLAKMTDLRIPEGTRVLIAEVQDIGLEEPFSLMSHNH